MLLFPVGPAAVVDADAALLAGSFATLLGWLAPGAVVPALDRRAVAEPLSTYFDNASLPATVTRLGRRATEWGRPLIELPGAIVIGYLLAAAVLAFTLWRVPGGWRRRRPDTGLWACAAAALWPRRSPGTTTWCCSHPRCCC